MPVAADIGFLPSKNARFAIRDAPTTGTPNPPWRDLTGTTSFESGSESNTDSTDTIEEDTAITFGGSTTRTITLSSLVRPGHEAFETVARLARTGAAGEFRVRPDGKRGRLGYTFPCTVSEGSHRIGTSGPQTYEGWRVNPAGDRVEETPAGGATGPAADSILF